MNSEEEQASIPIDELGRPGLPGQLVIVPIFKGSDETDESRLSDESERTFKIKAMLGKHPSSDTNISANIDADSGRSYVIASENAAYTKLATAEGELFLHHNKNREISLVEYQCKAKISRDARTKFLDALNPFLDQISYTANIPLHVTQITCIDTKHSIQSVDYTVPHPIVQINPHNAEVRTELIPVYALYREAKNSGSAFYKFLCYYKILEGIYLHLRPSIFKQAKKKSIEITRSKEVIPEGAVTLQNEKPDITGKSVKEIFDKRFTPNFRNRVAHYLTDRRRPLNVSDFGSVSEFGSELDLMEICVHIVIATQEQYVSEFLAKSV